MDEVDKMARLRVFRANGGNVYDLTLKKKQERIREARITELDLKLATKSWKKVSGKLLIIYLYLLKAKNSISYYASRDPRYLN